MIQCLYIQMLLHHPSGATSESNGAWANDWEIWKVNIFIVRINLLVNIIIVSISATVKTVKLFVNYMACTVIDKS